MHFCAKYSFRSEENNLKSCIFFWTVGDGLKCISLPHLHLLLCASASAQKTVKKYILALPSNGGALLVMVVAGIMIRLKAMHTDWQWKTQMALEERVSKGFCWVWKSFYSFIFKVRTFMTLNTYRELIFPIQDTLVLRGSGNYLVFPAHPFPGCRSHHFPDPVAVPAQSWPVPGRVGVSLSWCELFHGNLQNTNK